MSLRIVPYQQQTALSVVGAPRASVPNVIDPTGAAIAHLGAEVQKVSADAYEVQRAMDLQDRIGKFTAEVSTLELQFDRDQDYRSAPQRFKEQADALRDKYAEGLNDSVVATAFKRQAQTITTSKHVNVIRDAFKKESAYSIAALDTNIDTYATQAANARNPGEAMVVENQARIAIATAQASGFIDPVEAGKRERKFFEKRDTAVVIRDMSIDPMITASKLSLDPEYAKGVDPVQRERLTDQSWRRSESVRKAQDTAAEKERKRLGDENLKEAFSRLEKGGLTRDYVEGIRSTLEPTEYKSLLASLNGTDRKDDPVAYAELQGLVYSDPAGVERRAYALHQQGRIRNETLSQTINRAREISRQEGPRTAFERERQYITNAIKPSDLVPDAAASARYALVIREYEDFANGGKRTDAELREHADGLLKKYTQIDMIDLAKKTASGARPTPEKQLESISADEDALAKDFEAKKITQQEFNRKAETLKRARRAAEKAANAHGK